MAVATFNCFKCSLQVNEYIREQQTLLTLRIISLHYPCYNPVLLTGGMTNFSASLVCVM